MGTQQSRGVGPRLTARAVVATAMVALVALALPGNWRLQDVLVLIALAVLLTGLTYLPIVVLAVLAVLIAGIGAWAEADSSGATDMAGFDLNFGFAGAGVCMAAVLLRLLADTGLPWMTRRRRTHVRRSPK